MSKVYPSKVMKVNETDQSNYLSNETYIHYYERLKLMITSLFKWDNLPNNIPERFIEKVLFDYGQLAFFDDKNIGLMVARCTQFGNLNHYDEPIAWNCYSNNGYWAGYLAEDVEVIRNNKYAIPTNHLLDHHLQRLTNIERTIDNNLWYQRHLAIIQSPDNSRLTIQNLMKEHDEFGYMIYGNDVLDSKKLETIDFHIPFIGIELEDLKERKWNDLINMLGINSANTQKRERLITDEANANNQLVSLNVEVMLSERQRAVERINEKFKLDIKVSLRNPIFPIDGAEDTEEEEVING